MNDIPSPAASRLAAPHSSLLGAATGTPPPPPGRSQLLQSATARPGPGAACPVGRTGRLLQQRESHLPELSALRHLLATPKLPGVA